jgi:hypothetical protein
MLLGSLLLVLLFMPLLCFFKQYCWQKLKKEVSEWKMFTWLKDHMSTFQLAINKRKKGWLQFAKKVYEQIIQDGFKEKRKKEGEYSHLLPCDIIFLT